MKSREVPEIDATKLGVLVIDAQPAFWKYAFPNNLQGSQSIFQRLEHLFIFADWMDLPIITTFEEPVSQNGELPERLAKVFPSQGQKYTKKTYNATLEIKIAAAIKQMPVTQWAIAGAESDVCVLQSVLGLLRMGYQVFVLEDCLFTSEPHPRPALDRMAHFGAIIMTLKTMLYEIATSIEHTPWYPEGLVQTEGEINKPFPTAFIPPENWLPWEPAT